MFIIYVYEIKQQILNVFLKKIILFLLTFLFISKMQAIVSIREKNKIAINGYVYVKQKDLADHVTSFECEKRRGSGKGLSICKAKVKIAADMSVVGYVDTHSHAATAHVQVLEVRAKIKRRAEQT